MAKKSSKKYSFLNELQSGLMETAAVNRKGEVKFKRADLKNLIESAFSNGVKIAASGERVRFPIIGTLVRKDVPARKAGKGKNPFTGEEIMIKARPASKKPRWSFPKSMKEMFANKRYW